MTSPGLDPAVHAAEHAHAWGWILSALPLPAAMFDGDYRCLAANDAFCVLFHGAGDAMHGCIDSDALGPQLAHALRRAVLDALSGDAGTLELPGADAPARWFEVRASTPEHDQSRVLVVLTECTAQRRAEEHLELGMQRLATLSALGRDWYWEQDEQLRFVSYAMHAEHKSPTPIMGVLGRTRFELDFDWPSEQAREAHARTLAERRAFRDLVLTDRRSGRVVSTSGQPVFGPDGVFRGYRGVARDISEQVHARDQALRLRDLYAVMMQANIAVSRSVSDEALFASVCSIAVQHGHFAHARVAQADPRTGIMHTVASMGEKDVPAELLRIALDPRLPEGRGPAAHALRAGSHHVCEDVLQEAGSVTSSVQLARTGLRAYAVLPLRRQGRVSGLLQVFARRSDCFDQELVAMLDALASNVSYALDNLHREHARHAAEMALRESENRFRDFAEAAGEFVWETALDGRFSYVSSRVQSVWQHSDQELIGRHPEDFMPPGEPERVRDWMAEHMREDGSFRDLEHRIVTRDGEIRWLNLSAVGVYDDAGQRVGHRGTCRDVTERKNAEARISFLATRDPLTELPNRVLFKDRLEQALLAARRAGQSLALMFIDLDRFKQINDTLGHQVGDLLLKEVANRMLACIRKGDTLSRLGGDEFVVALEGLQQAEVAAQVADKIIRSLARPFELGGQRIDTSCSIGISIFPLDAQDERALMKNADTAMYHAKERGRNNFQFFSPEMNLRAIERQTLESELRLALERDELVLHYQPQLSLREGRVTGVEALLRWQHPQRGLLAPGTFLAAAEESGLVERIGEWVLQHVCRQARRWQDAGRRPLPFAVNVSSRQFQRAAAFLGNVASALKAARLDARWLEIEVTEALLLEHPEEHMPVLHELGELGVSVAIDDFGTGYSSVAYLEQLPIACLKIDRSFVRNIVHAQRDRTVVRAVVALAHGLELRVSAEGVENPAQLALLSDMGCDAYQGDLFSAAVPPEALAELAARTAAL